MLCCTTACLSVYQFHCRWIFGCFWFFPKNAAILNVFFGTSLAVQWLRFCIFTVEGMGLIPSWGTKILPALWWGQKIKSSLCLLTWPHGPSSQVQVSLIPLTSLGFFWASPPKLAAFFLSLLALQQGEISGSRREKRDVMKGMGGGRGQSMVCICHPTPTALQFLFDFYLTWMNLS